MRRSAIRGEKIIKAAINQPRRSIPPSWRSWIGKPKERRVKRRSSNRKAASPLGRGKKFMVNPGIKHRCVMPS